ncbi:carboxy terminal-processing peptidase [Pedobacter nutrimenti]|uniref:carboxy terminal-processing peptidase n=1 Tax=Pedobacter nutrimenti TaxID=1241337 RepID=UPI0029301CAD|nr:carboxy terminal-processing peptidase [Pedobacter nutrimenti]
MKLYKISFILMFHGMWMLSSANGQVTLLANGHDFEQLPQHALIAKTVASMVANYHYKKTKIDDSLSTRIFNDYLERLDKAHTLFLASDVKGFEKYRFQMDDALLSGDLSAAFEIYRIYTDRMNERVDYSLEVLKMPLNLSSSDVFDFTRTQLPWFSSVGQEQQYWNEWVRYELILLKANQKTEKAAQDILTKRYEKLKERLGKLKSENAFEEFMNAFVGTIDPHTLYLSPRNADEFSVMMNKSLVGVGLELTLQNEYPTITNVIKGGPSEKSDQIVVNDRILAIAEGENGEFEDVVGWDLNEVIQKVRGAVGSTVRLRILPPGATMGVKPKEVTLVRDKIVLEDQKVKSEVKIVKQGNKERKIGIIAIPNFYFDANAFNKGDKDYASTSHDVRKALGSFKSQGVEGVMIDLRNNGGGSLKEAIDLTGLFINYGPVVQLRDARNKITVNSDTDSLLVYGGPLTVLINRLSASSSEIFAAAMQDYGRAVIIGEQSFGKGTAQNTYALNQMLQQPDKNYGQFNMTFAKFYRISGASTQNHGVTPDVSFPSSGSSFYVGESTMKNALPYDEIPATPFSPVFQLKEINALLEKDHEKRVKNNPQFQVLQQQVSEYKRLNEQKSVVLDLKKITDAKAVNSTTILNKDKTDYVKEESLKVTAELVSEMSNKLK